VPVAIIKKRLCLDPSLYQILQVLSLSLFEKKLILRAFDELNSEEKYERVSNQLRVASATLSQIARRVGAWTGR
jgi:hypothetical protein